MIKQQTRRLLEIARSGNYKPDGRRRDQWYREHHARYLLLMRETMGSKPFRRYRLSQKDPI